MVILYPKSLANLEVEVGIRHSRHSHQILLCGCPLSLADAVIATRGTCPEICFISGMYGHSALLNTLRPRQNGRHFADDTFKRIFVNENVSIFIEISLKFVPKDPINNIPALVQIMAWRRPGDRPLFEPMMISLPTHICVTRPQWVKVIKSVNYIQRAYQD